MTLPADRPELLALAAVSYGVSTTFGETVIRLSAGTPVWPSVRDALKAGLTPAAGEASLGIVLAVIVLEQTWAAVAHAPLVLAVYQAHARLGTLWRETAAALATFGSRRRLRPPPRPRDPASRGGCREDPLGRPAPRPRQDRRGRVDPAYVRGG